MIPVPTIIPRVVAGTLVALAACACSGAKDRAVDPASMNRQAASDVQAAPPKAEAASTGEVVAPVAPSQPEQPQRARPVRPSLEVPGMPELKLSLRNSATSPSRLPR